MQLCRVMSLTFHAVVLAISFSSSQFMRDLRRMSECTPALQGNVQPSGTDYLAAAADSQFVILLLSSCCCCFSSDYRSSFLLVVDYCNLFPFKL